MELKKNEPKLAGVRAPWDGGWGFWDRVSPKNLWRSFRYTRKYGWFWAPSSMDPWRYRKFLRDLDEVCLRSLKSHGALTAKELADWLNREQLLRTKPKKTGIHRISVATASDWITLAHRRGLIVPWSRAGANRRRMSGGVHWELSERGGEAVHSRLVALIGRLPYPSLLPIVIGGLAGWLEWLTLHQVVIVAIFYVALLALLAGVPAFWTIRSEKRENPGIAVVAIETLRSAGKPIPSL